RISPVAIAHNGNLTKASELHDQLEEKGQVFQTTADSEIILHLMAQPTVAGKENNLVQTVRRIEGAFSLVIMTEKELIGVRDPHGFRPLSLGSLGEGWVLASETCAFDLIHAKFVRDIQPGEIVIIDKTGPRSIQASPDHQQRAFCIFEYVYFARPDSTIANRNVYEVRKEMGRQLAREHPIHADIVVPVPDSVSCPPHMNPCVYGIDFPDRSKLMAANHSLDEIRKYLNADSLAYLSQAGMVKATGLPAGAFCMACYDGNYPVPFDPLMDKHIIERRRARVESLGEALVKEDLQPRLL